MAKSRQAAYLRRQSLLALRGLAAVAGVGVDVSDTGTGWRVFRVADGVTLVIHSRYQVASAFLDGLAEGVKLATTARQTGQDSAHTSAESPRKP